MLPLRDDNPTRRTAWMTWVLIGACVFVYFGVQRGHAGNAVDPQTEQVQEVKFTLGHAAIPRELVKRRPLTRDEVAAEFGPTAPAAVCDTAGPAVVSATPSCESGKNIYLALLFTMFLHGSLVHLGGNMLFLWVFGNNIEDARGPWRYLAFYLVAGLVATLAHVAIDPNSAVPVVGASGAIAGVMGAYIVLYPNAPILTLIFVIIPLFRRISAKWVLGFWFASQFLLTQPGVAWAAHVGGFAFGVLAGLLWRATGGASRRAPARQPAH
ncbi:MAG TPA: rhomboid family intramembrane serine protease [Acidimicrobiales bacterium]|nr:rhomboid family intramembrane serine protease [Acidimicrobiales bacterium]